MCLSAGMTLKQRQCLLTRLSLQTHTHSSGHENMFALNKQSKDNMLHMR